MADPDRPLFADATDEIARLGADLRQIADLRWKLARLELDAAVRSVKRLAIVVVVAAIMGLTALPILGVGAAHLLPESMRAGCLLIVGLILLLGGILATWLARRRFRREFVGLDESIEELREDLVWLQEWSGHSEDD